ncbi:MAG: ClpXP protease specificity-enhancing factor [Gammaproteobacteria bacterium]|nr:MAG: ClpXP protease specificity-enhancing factor [Gammaproteobacteria bacterium]
MTSSRPYLLRALYEWICDNGLTPHLLVDATLPRVEVPEAYVNQGKIVLNISPQAVQHLNIDQAWVSFDARFSGTPMHVAFPVQAVLAIYAKENGKGMMFEEEEMPEPPPEKGRKPGLKVVK